MSREAESRSSFFWRLVPVLLISLLLVLIAFLMGSVISIEPFTFTYVGTIGAWRFLQSALMDGAVAVLIAWSVKEMIEKGYDEQQRNSMLAAANVSRQKVLRILFGSFFDEETVEEIYKSIFSSTLIRKDMTVSYRISTHPQSAWLVRFEVMYEYTITNVATTGAHFDPEAAVANYAAIFRDDAGLSTPMLKSAKIGAKKLSAAEIRALNEALQRTETPVRFPFQGQEMKAGDSLHVRITYEREKLVCDTEVMTMSYPTKKVTLAVENECVPGLDVGVREIGQRGFSVRDDIKPDGAAWRCVNDGILLANNGWVLYWNDTKLRPSEIPGPRHPVTLGQ